MVCANTNIVYIMSKYKIFFKTILIVQFLIVFTSCGLHSGFENCKNELVKSKDQLDSISALFLNQNTLLAVSRRDYKWSAFERFANIFKPIKTEYNVIGKSLNYNTFRFEVDGNEDTFFQKDYRTIYSENRNLKTFLDSQSISYELFNFSRKVLFEYDFISIDSSPTDNAFLIHIGKLDGILYSTKKDITLNNPRYEELIPISENWYYFKKEF